MPWNFLILVKPLGTGFSFTSPEEIESSNNNMKMYDGIIKSLNYLKNIHKEFKNQDLYITANGYMAGFSFYLA